jgi:GNAT superfamily N-acetyltransferase
MSIVLRVAHASDIPELEVLIPLSTRVLQAPYYSTRQLDGALGTVFGVDSQLIADGSYFVAEEGGRIVGCGGWSQRQTLFGGDHGKSPAGDGLLDPACDPARIRAFFVHPEWPRRGIGRMLIQACEAAARQAGFRSMELVATLAGERLYAACGYRTLETLEIPLVNGLTLPTLKMYRQLTPMPV